MNKLRRLIDNEVHYLPNYKLLPDEVLIRKPINFISPLSKPTTINYSMKGFKFTMLNFQQLSQAIHDYIVTQNDAGADYTVEDNQAKVIVLNSNFHNVAISGFESYVKHESDKVRKTTRSVQGNGTSFNSAVELIVLTKIPGRVIRAYKTKCFPQTGLIQIPGVLCLDLSDGRLVVNAIINMVNQIYDTQILFTDNITEQIDLMNFKFHICTTTPRMIPNMRKLSKLVLETAPAHGSIISTSRVEFECQFTFKIKFSDEKGVTVKFFNSGKINILGAKAVSDAEHIHEYITTLFDKHWDDLIAIVPNTDADEAKVRSHIADQERLEQVRLDAIYNILHKIVLSPQ